MVYPMQLLVTFLLFEAFEDPHCFEVPAVALTSSTVFSTAEHLAAMLLMSTGGKDKGIMLNRGELMVIYTGACLPDASLLWLLSHSKCHVGVGDCGIAMTSHMAYECARLMWLAM